MAFVFALVQLQTSFQEDTRQRFHDVGLVHDGDLFAPGGHGMFKSVFQQTTAARTGVDTRRHGHGMRVIVDLDVMLVADVKAFQVFAHHHQINLVKPATRHNGAGRAQVRIQRKFFAQTHVA